MFLHYLKQDLKFALKTRAIITVLFLGPIAMSILFGGVYKNEYLNNVPIAVMDEDGTDLSRTLTQYFANDDHFDVVRTANTTAELEQLIQEKQVYGAVYIPIDLSKNIKAGKPTDVVFITDGTNAIISNNLYAGAATIIQSVSAGVSMKVIAAKGGLSPTGANHVFLSFQTAERMLFDPKMTYMNYLLFGLIAVLFQQLAISAMSTLVFRNPDEVAKENMFVQILSKFTVCALGFGLSFSIAIGVLHLFLGLPIVGNIAIAYGLSFLFLIALMSPILILCALFKDSIKLAMVSFTISMPIFLTSGYTWPLAQTPKPIVYAVRLLWPYMSYGRPLTDVLLKNTPLSAVVPNMLQMMAYILFWMPIAFAFYRYRYPADGINKDTP